MGLLNSRQIQDIFEKALSMNEDKEMSVKTSRKKLLEINVNFMVGIISYELYREEVWERMWIGGKENTFSKGYINVCSMRGGIILCGREKFNIRRKVGIKLDLYLRKVYIDD
ncbi:hypothetical protein CWI38_0016p0020 [Hamiltosporidium tvaerminnensis]|uniref:Uncharacterized protein n=1 Tax=Hamiltosporidium tvaerminnensis TaxID=1176355 RepID=A0A4Q9M5J1_9MICR|nr:hypothetical protein CWI38_0016p0020 [Hamiltosporidium tvaerminnensis]